MQTSNVPMDDVPCAQQAQTRTARAASRRDRTMRFKSYTQDLPPESPTLPRSEGQSLFETTAFYATRIVSCLSWPFRQTIHASPASRASRRDAYVQSAISSTVRTLLFAGFIISMIVLPFRLITINDNPHLISILKQHKALYAAAPQQPQNTAEILDLMHKSYRNLAEFKLPSRTMADSSAVFLEDAVLINNIAKNFTRLDLPDSAEMIDVFLEYARLHADIAVTMNKIYLNSTALVMLSEFSLNNFTGNLERDYRQKQAICTVAAPLQHSLKLLDDNVAHQLRLKWLQIGLKQLTSLLNDTERVYNILDTSRSPVANVLRRDWITGWRPPFFPGNANSKKARQAYDTLSQVQKPSFVSLREDVLKLSKAAGRAEVDLQQLWVFVVQRPSPVLTDETRPHLERVKARATELKAIGKDMRRAREEARKAKPKESYYNLVEEDDKDEFIGFAKIAKARNEKSFWYKIQQWTEDDQSRVIETEESIGASNEESLWFKIQQWTDEGKPS